MRPAAQDYEITTAAGQSESTRRDTSTAVDNAVDRAISLIGQPKHKPVYVYFIRAYDPPDPADASAPLLEPQVKIGYSTDPYRRLEDLRANLSKCGDWLAWCDGEWPYLDLLGYVDGGRELEKQLHRAFAQHRVEGEWFWLDPIDEWIDQILSNDCVCALCQYLDLGTLPGHVSFPWHDYGLAPIPGVGRQYADAAIDPAAWAELIAEGGDVR